MTNVLNRNSCLVLNKGWTPVGTVSLKRAIIMLFSIYENSEPKAKVIDHESYQTFSWEDWSKIRPKDGEDVIQGCSVVFRIPEVILLTRYDKFPKPRVHFSRRTLYKRDGMKCQYCGSKPGSEELTIDHVIPKSQGGRTSWENCTLACVSCNAKKANRTPEQAGMKLLTQPRKPRVHLFKSGSMKRVKSWESFLGEMYWSTPLVD